jgi:hypothetical protein
VLSRLLLAYIDLIFVDLLERDLEELRLEVDERKVAADTIPFLMFFFLERRGLPQAQGI